MKEYVIPDLMTLRGGGKLAFSRALSALEQSYEMMLPLLSECYAQPRAQVIGITGPPGVGKSTLLSEMISCYRKANRTVGVIAIDPSSKKSGGAFLGDRVRFSTDPDDQGVFVRSMAARQRLGGLSDHTVAAMVLMRAVFDIVLIETVGVGQSETDVSSVADSIVFCVQPGSGDALQFMKAGIAEIPDIALVTKADLGKAAERAKADLRGALSLTVPRTDKWDVKVLSLSSSNSGDIQKFIALLDEHNTWMSTTGELSKRRETQAQEWLFDGLKDNFGCKGVAFIQNNGLLPEQLDGVSPFDLLAVVGTKLNFALRA
ncbi:ArgK protein [Kiloniella litopenaei]|uniref:ArgK protein n=1 Tax=Kiloniella litopenaei TaxID=1549748 RepID=A0A0M2R8S7_9PROT|nr:GTP-binding protein [Kiloniella litopenaei]KKJ78247.1 ArgK protein [Kiloniella litopenaei]